MSIFRRVAAKPPQRPKRSWPYRRAKRSGAPARVQPKRAGQLLIIGLGNPGEEYANTRHNAGADAVRLLSKRLGLTLTIKKDVFADVAKAPRLTLACPTTFMNQSGKAAAALTRFFKVKPESTVVVHDDMDLPLGRIKIVFNRGSGGHKGVESVMRALKTEAFTRVRIGTMGSGRSQRPGMRELENIVVKRLTPQEKQRLARGIRKAADALMTMHEKGRESAMSKHN